MAATRSEATFWTAGYDSLHPLRRRDILCIVTFRCSVEAPMFPALFPDMRTVSTRVAIYAGCVSSLFLAALLFSFYGSLQPPKRVPAEGGNPASAQVRPRLVAGYGKLPLSFELNQGQAEAGVKFLSRGRGYGLFLTSREATLELQSTSVVRCQWSEPGSSEPGAPGILRCSVGARQRTTDHGQRTFCG